MFLAIFGKEFIIINEELVVYLSFLTVLTILISNFGSQISSQFLDQANQIAQNYSQGSQEKVKGFLKLLIVNYKTINFISYLLNFELAILSKLLIFKNTVIKAVIAAEYKIA